MTVVGRENMKMFKNTHFVVMAPSDSKIIPLACVDYIFIQIKTECSVDLQAASELLAQ